MKDLAGRTAFVSGAGSGIGLGIARQLARAGVKVALGDIRADAVRAARREIEALGGRAVDVVVDVSNRVSVEDAADQAERAFGPVHILCNNAGVAMHGVPLEALAPADWDWAVGVNIYGVIHGIQVFVPRMRRHGEGGHVVNTASIAGLQVRPDWHTGAYCMTKYAVMALSEALEQELHGSGVGVSVLCPGAVATEFHLSGRARPERLGGPYERPEIAFIGEHIRDGLSPDRVGARVIQAIRDEELFIFTHAEPRERIEARHQRIMAAFDRIEELDKAEPKAREPLHK